MTTSSMLRCREEEEEDEEDVFYVGSSCSSLFGVWVLPEKHRQVDSFSFHILRQLAPTVVLFFRQSWLRESREIWTFYEACVSGRPLFGVFVA